MALVPCNLAKILNSISHSVWNMNMIRDWLFFLFFPLTPIFADNNSRELAWGALDDVVMGGVSESTFQIDRRGSEIGGPTGVFKGFSCQTAPPLSSHYLVSCMQSHKNYDD